MRSIARRAAAVALLLAAGACGSHNKAAKAADDGTPRPSRARYRADLITAEEMEAQHWPSVYDMISALRGNWLNLRGNDTLYGEPGAVQVQMDGQRLGDVSALRALPVVNIAYVQYFDPISAAARWGLGYNHGAILVATRTR